MGYESLSTVVVLVILMVIAVGWLPRRTVNSMKKGGRAPSGQVLVVVASGGCRQRYSILRRAYAAAERGYYAAGANEHHDADHGESGAYSRASACGGPSSAHIGAIAAADHGAGTGAVDGPAFQRPVRADSGRAAGGRVGIGRAGSSQACRWSMRWPRRGAGNVWRNGRGECPSASKVPVSGKVCVSDQVCGEGNR